MGRIADALRRNDLDAGRTPGVPSSAPNLSPWLMEEEPEGGDGFEHAEFLPGTTMPGEAPASLLSAETPPAWGGFDTAAVERLVVSSTAEPLLVEQFRGLAATLHRAQAERRLKSVIVTSASPGDGKSHVAINLGLTLSDSYRRKVLLIDADLRRPSLHAMFRVPNAGLSEALRTSSDEKVAVVPITDTLTLLPAGRPASSPLAGLSSDRMKRIVEDATSFFDWVIVDSPPAGVLAEGRLLAETVDAALLVVRAGVTRFQEVQAAADTIGRERILGVVLNGVDPAEIRAKNYYGHYYGREPRRSR